MARLGRKPVRPGRATTAVALGALGLFVISMAAGLGSESGGWPIGAVGAAMVIVGVALLTTASMRGGDRSFVQGTVHVVKISDPPVIATEYGRCEMQVLVDSPAHPGQTVMIRDPRVPVDKWPEIGDTLPALIAVSDARRIKIQWERVGVYGSEYDEFEEMGLYGDEPPRPDMTSEFPTVQADPPPKRKPQPVPVLEGELVPNQRRPTAAESPLTVDALDFSDAGEGDAGEDDVVEAQPVGRRMPQRKTQPVNEQRSQPHPAFEPRMQPQPVHETLPQREPQPASEQRSQPHPAFEPRMQPQPMHETLPQREPQPMHETLPQREPQPVHETLPQREPQPVPDTLPQREPQPVPDTLPQREPQPVPTRTGGGGSVFAESTAAHVLATQPPARPATSGTIHGVGYTVQVTDLRRSQRFYHDMLGFYELDGGPDSVVLASGDTRIVLMTTQDAESVRKRLVHLNLEVGDVEAVYEELKVRGVRFAQPPRVVSRGERLEQVSASFKDPDGHGIAITQWKARTPAT